MDVDTFSKFFALLTVLSGGLALGLIGLMVVARFNPRAAATSAGLKERFGQQVLPLTWIVALTATLGSLYYSEVANFTPCKLCWYQRIAMYPLAIVLGIAALKRDLGVRLYVLPVVAVGTILSTYHYFLQRFPSLESGASCDPTAPCTATWVWEFHFISIPFMALSGFVLIGSLLLWSRIKEVPTS